MNALEVLKALRDVNASLHRDGDNLVLNSPRGSISSTLAEEIRINRTELLDLLKVADDSERENVSIVPFTRPKNIPLGLTQQRFWYLASVSPESAIYNLPAAFRLSGELNVAVLELTINHIIDRHEILRTRIVELRSEVVQAIEPAINFRLNKVDLSHVDAAMDEMMHQIDVARDTPIPMNQAPMLKTTLYRLGPKDHVLFWMPHHVIWDGWSFDIFLRELQYIYGALEAGDDPVLTPLPLQFVDYALWQRQLSEGDKLTQQLEFWRTHLSGELPVLALTTDRPRPDMMSYEGGRVVLDIDGGTIERLTQIGKKENATLFMVLLAGFYAFLYRYTGQEDLIVGSPAQSRINEDTDNIIGVFVNTLVLRTQITPSLSFRQLVRQVKELCVSVYDHQDTPFELLVDAFEKERTMSRNPLYQVLFSYQDVTERGATLGSLNLNQIHIETSVAPTDLTVWLMETGNGLIGGIDYATSLFDRTTVEHMITHYCQLLVACVDDPHAAIGSLPMLSSRELEWLAQQASGPVLELPGLSVDQLIEEKASQTPDAIAVEADNVSLTYQQLASKSALVKARLRHKNIGEGDLVGVCVKRNADLLPLLLGIFKSGAVYVPLDPDFPKNRLAHIISDAELSAIITDEQAGKSLPQNAKMICLMANEMLEEKSLYGEGTSQSSLSATRLAYVIYTSGSTGKPKGVKVSHHAVVNLLLSMRKLLSVQSNDRLLAITTLSFDISVLELFLPLISGAAVIVAGQETTRDGEALKQLIISSEPSILQATPATWRMLKNLDWMGAKSLKVLCGGEEMPKDIAQWLSAISKLALNVYGPTETTVWSSMYQVKGNEHHIPIGAPIHNTRLYVLDKQLNMLPAGVKGDLYIAGDGLAVGYKNLSDMTAERFVNDTLVNDGSRMYWTGDQAKWLSNGNLEFYGRNDHQVKIRGFRIELGEIETGLLLHPLIQQTVVIIREDRPGDVRLVAYVVVKPSHNITLTDVRRHLQTNLPGYMIPQYVIELDKIPMTPNGKIDRKALPRPAGGILDENSHIPPRTEMERSLAKIWQDVLNVDRVSIHDNFFELGGHSLLSMQVITIIREKLGGNISPKVLLFNDLEQISQQCESPTEGLENNTQQNYMHRNLLDRIKTKMGM